MEEKNLKVTCPERVVTERIKDYFGEREYEANVTMIGRMADVSISYEDFKPTRKVRRELEDMMDNVEITSLERRYSERTYLKTLDELMSEGREIYIKEDDGSLKKTSITMLIEETLYHRTLN